MKQKTTWKTIAGLGAAAVAWASLSKNLSGGVLIPKVPIPPPPPPEYKRPTCKPNEVIRFDVGTNRFVCVPTFEGKPPPPPPSRPRCKGNEWARWDTGTQTWTCVPKL